MLHWSEYPKSFQGHRTTKEVGIACARSRFAAGPRSFASIDNARFHPFPKTSEGIIHTAAFLTNLAANPSLSDKLIPIDNEYSLKSLSHKTKEKPQKRQSNDKQNPKMVVYKINCEITTKGRKVAATKRRVKWQFGYSETDSTANSSSVGCMLDDIRGPEHEVVMVWSLSSGKQVILMDGLEVHFGRNTGSLKIEHTWTTTKIAGYKGQHHTMTLVAHAAPPLFNNNNDTFRQFDLLIDGKSYWDSPTLTELSYLIQGTGSDALPSHATISSTLPKAVLLRAQSAPSNGFSTMDAFAAQADSRNGHGSPTSVMEQQDNHYNKAAPARPQSISSRSSTSPSVIRNDGVRRQYSSGGSAVPNYAMAWANQSNVSQHGTTSNLKSNHVRKHSGSVPDLLLLSSTSSSMETLHESPKEEYTKKQSTHMRKKSGSVPDLLLLSTASTMESVPEGSETNIGLQSRHERTRSGSFPDLRLLSLETSRAPAAAAPNAHWNIPPVTSGNPFEAVIAQRRRSSASQYGGGDLGRTESVPNLLYYNIPQQQQQPQPALVQTQQNTHHLQYPYNVAGTIPPPAAPAAPHMMTMQQQHSMSSPSIYHQYFNNNIHMQPQHVPAGQATAATATTKSIPLSSSLHNISNIQQQQHATTADPLNISTHKQQVLQTFDPIGSKNNFENTITTTIGGESDVNNFDGIEF